MFQFPWLQKLFGGLGGSAKRKKHRQRFTAADYTIQDSFFSDADGQPVVIAVCYSRAAAKIASQSAFESLAGTKVILEESEVAEPAQVVQLPSGKTVFVPVLRVTFTGANKKNSTSVGRVVFLRAGFPEHARGILTGRYGRGQLIRFGPKANSDPFQKGAPPQLTIVDLEQVGNTEKEGAPAGDGK